MSKKPVQETFDVTVLARREVSVFPKLGVEVKQYLITYVAGGMPPSTITIDKEKWSAEVEKKYIREDILRRRTEKSEVYRV